MLALAGEARYEWQHYIPHRKRDVVLATERGVGIPKKKKPRRREDAETGFREKGAASRLADVPGTARRRGARAVRVRVARGVRLQARRRAELERRARPGLVAKAAEDTENVFRVP